MALPNVLEGTWSEISKLAPQFGDRRLRLTVLPTTSMKPKPTEEEVRLANEALLNCAVDLGYSVGVDNEQIDIDLAREYDDDHSNNRT